MMEGSSPALSLSSMNIDAHEIVPNRVSGLARLNRYYLRLIVLFDRFFASHRSPFWIQLSYFLSLCLWGSLALMMLKPGNPAFSPRYIDMLFMSTAALTNSGLATVDMEDLSSSQLAVLTLLMLFGGEVFVSMLGLLLRRADKQQEATDKAADSDRMELGSIDPRSAVERSDNPMTDGKGLRYDSVRCLGYVVLGYIVLIHVGGALIILRYVTAVSSARDVLKRKGIDGLLFSVSVTVSSFSNTGLTPTSENMVVFKDSSGLLLLIILQVLAGNTMFPLFLRLGIWGLRKFTKMVEFENMMKNPREIGFGNLTSNLRTAFLSLTVVGFIAIQVAMFCAMDWSSGVFDGLNSYQKIVNALFMAVNTRHAGEGTVDLSVVSSAVLVLFIFMMYLPSSTSFAPFEEDDTPPARNEREKKGKGLAVQNLMISPLSCLLVFVIVICITERRKLFIDPLNFNVLKIVFEIIRQAPIPSPVIIFW